jgi:hypothetical protein
MKDLSLGKLAGLRLSAAPSAVAGTFLLWGALGGFAWSILGLSPGDSVLASGIALVLHWISVLLHHLGHAWTARRVGHPMTGVRLWSVIGMDIYPSGEPALPAGVHISRALGGPAASLLVAVVAAGAAIAIQPLGGVFWWPAAFVSLDSLVLLLGGLVPLGFTDGGSLMRWWGKP